MRVYHPITSFFSSYKIFFLILIFFVIRIFIAAYTSLGIDESYVAVVAKNNLSWSYFDHPPLHFWFIWCTQFFLGHFASPFLLRLPFIILFTGTTYLVFDTTKRLFNPLSGFFAILALNLSPVFGLSTASWLLPDGPMVFFMSLSLWFLVKIFWEPTHSLNQWVAVGLCAGLACLSKYNAIFLFLGVVLFLISSKKNWSYFRIKGPYIATLMTLLVLTPVFFWNAQNHWISFAFQGGRGSVHGFFPQHVFVNILGQMAWIGPWIWFPMVWRFCVGLRSGYGVTKEQNKIWFLCCMALGPLVLFTAANLWGDRGLPHWQVPGYLPLFPVLGYWAAVCYARLPRRIVVWFSVSAGVWALLLCIVVSQSLTGWVSRFKPQWFAKGDPSFDLVNWTVLGQQLEFMSQQNQKEGPFFVVVRNWIDAGKVGVVLPDQLSVVCVCDQPHQFAFFHNPKNFIGHNAWVVVRAGNEQEMQIFMDNNFDHWLHQPSVRVVRGTDEIELAVYEGFGFLRKNSAIFPTK